MTKSTRSNRANKFTKPRPDFPLFPHTTGRWAKKVRGKLRYFGKCNLTTPPSSRVVGQTSKLPTENLSLSPTEAHRASLGNRGRRRRASLIHISPSEMPPENSESSAGLESKTALRAVESRATRIT